MLLQMEEAQALLLKNFRVGKGNPSACAQWLTEMAPRDLLAPIPFREVFVILALFLPQLTFVEEATTRQELWSSPTVRKFGLFVDITPTATGLQGMHEFALPFQDRNYGVVPLFESLASSWTSHQQLPGCRACMNSHCLSFVVTNGYLLPSALPEL